MDAKCKTCGSPAPHLHPAVQLGGEVGICIDPFHLTPTTQNTPEYIADVVSERGRRTSKAEGAE